MKLSSPAHTILATMLQHVGPWLVMIVLIALTCVPGVIPALGRVMPPLPLMAIFYWSIHRPDGFGAPSAFVAGLLVDLLIGAPLGVTAGLYAVSHLLLLRQRTFFRGNTFVMLWAGYALTQASVTLGQSLLWWWLGGVTPTLGLWLGMNILGLAVFPVLAAGLSRLHKWLAA